MDFTSPWLSCYQWQAQQPTRADYKQTKNHWNAWNASHFHFNSLKWFRMLSHAIKYVKIEIYKIFQFSSPFYLGCTPHVGIATS